MQGMYKSTIVAVVTITVMLGLFLGGILIMNRSTDTTKEEQTMDNTPKLANYQPQDTISNLEIIDLKEGTGKVVPEGATVRAHYTGAVARDGKIFQASKDFGDQPIEFGLDEVVKGWTRGVPGMKEGGTRRLLIPAELAYGPAPPPNSGIPPNADLVFDIELVSIKQ
jgi:peptidylprolyl isomerase